MNWTWMLMLGVLIAGIALVWVLGLARRSLFGSVFAMALAVAAAVVVTPSLREQVDLLVLVTAIGLLLLCMMLLGWLWNVVALIHWRRLQRRAGPTTGDAASWHPWVAWYPVKTAAGLAWMRMVEVRLHPMVGPDSTPVVEYRELVRNAGVGA